MTIHPSQTSKQIEEPVLKDRKIRQRHARIVGLCLVIFNLTGCSNSNWVPLASLEPASTSIASPDVTYHWPTEQKNVVAPGTLVSISSSDRNLNGTFTVNIDGILNLPHAKSLPTRGLDPVLLKERIHDAYRNYFKSLADLRVKIVTKNVLIVVQGLVTKPGQYSVSKMTSLDEIIAQAGGLQDRYGAEKVRFINIKGPHSSGIISLTEYHSGRDSIAPHWTGGERLFFQTSATAETIGSVASPHTVQVLGQVRNPAEYTATPDSTFFSYLLQAGGPTDRADLGHVTLIRADGNTTRARTFNSHDFDDIPTIEPGDTILVNADVASPLEKSSRVAASIAGILTSLSVLAIAAL